MIRRFLLVGLVAVILAASAGLPMTGLFTLSGRPMTDFSCEGCNVLFITIDTLRVDHVSAYGYFQETTPNMDSLARKGVLFTNAFSNIPHTPPSHWSIFTGLYPYRHGNYLSSDEGENLTTLPEILADRGYITSGFISSRILSGFKDKFEYFNWGNNDGVNNNFLRNDANITTADVISWLESNASTTESHAVSWLENHSSERFFMWIHYYDPHSPYDPPYEYDIYNYSDSPFYSDAIYDNKGIGRRETIRDQVGKYDGEIRYTDHNIGMVLDKLNELGLSDNTLVVVLSDHGENFGEHNFTDFGYDDERACVFHGKTLYDEEVHIPLIIMNPKSDAGGIVVDDLVESVDVMPTVLGILGIPGTENDGESLLSIIEDEKRNKDYAILQTKPKNGNELNIGIRTDEWKFVSIMSSDLDLENEIAEQEGEFTVHLEDEEEPVVIKEMLLRPAEGEKTNFFESDRFIAASLEEKLKGLVSLDSIDIRDPDENTISLLRSLGYMQ